jgi:hypothetical protein
MTIQATSRTWRDVVIHEPAALAAAQPHQVLISTASVSILANYAADSGFLAVPFNIILAIGIEWAWLRGMASARVTSSPWVGALNWSAFGILVLWGLLWGLKQYGVLPEQPHGALGWVLAASHVLPVAWLSLCAAMTHADAERELAQIERIRTARAEAEAEAERQRQTAIAEEERQRQAALADEYRRQKLALEIEDERKRKAQERRHVFNVSHGVNHLTLSDAVQTPSNNDLRLSIVTLLRQSSDRKINVSQEARRLGISRAKWYALRNDAIALGELPPQTVKSSEVWRDEG